MHMLIYALAGTKEKRTVNGRRRSSPVDAGVDYRRARLMALPRMYPGGHGRRRQDRPGCAPQPDF